MQVADTIYISGQLGLDANTMTLVAGGVQAEARQALQNMGAILEAAGVSYKNGGDLVAGSPFSVVKTTVLLKDIADFAAVNEVYAECERH